MTFYGTVVAFNKTMLFIIRFYDIPVTLANDNSSEAFYNPLWKSDVIPGYFNSTVTHPTCLGYAGNTSGHSSNINMNQIRS